MPTHKDQRVGVFVDVQNMYYSAKQFYNAKVNFAHILNRAISGRKLIRAIAYVIKADIKDEVNFFEALEKIGYDVRSKDLQTFLGGAKKGDWDVGIAMDIMRMAAKLDVIVLVSGDGDFKDLLEHVKSLGCRAEVVAFRKTSSSRILGQADSFIDLDKELDKALIKSNRYPRKKPEFVRREGPHEFKEQHDFKDRHEFKDSPSLIQKLNMDQPDLSPQPPEQQVKAPALQARPVQQTRPAQPAKPMPRPAQQAPVVRQEKPVHLPAPSQRRELLPPQEKPVVQPEQKKTEQKKPEKKKTEQKKPEKKKTEQKKKDPSVFDRVISSVTKKKR
jgi:uncharacterized LabA/DUF88 family protein